MKIKSLIFCVIVGAANICYAVPDKTVTEMEVIKKYIHDLQTADYKDISQLFETNGYVVSTSRGKMNAKEFFYSFLPEIQTAKTEIHQTFTSINSDRFAVRFHFSFKLKDGSEGDGEYMDEFVFVSYSPKLQGVYMFENLKLKS